MRVAFPFTLLLALTAAASAPPEPPPAEENGGGETGTPAIARGLTFVGHAHIDLAYRWRWNETVSWITRDTFLGVLEVMRQEPGLTFVQSQMALYDAVMRAYPDLYREIKAEIAGGLWAPVAGMWSEPDVIFPSGESFIRQRLAGAQFLRQEFGLPPDAVMWVPDSFCGHAGTLPAILGRCGIKYYVLMRGAPPDMPVFWWESRDGTRILAYSLPLPYDFELGKLTPRVLRGMEDWFKHACGVQNAMVLFGTGDHGGGPRMKDVERKRALERTANGPAVSYGTPETYFREHVDPHGGAFPVHRGSLGALEGMPFLSEAGLKQLNRQCEHLLLTAEKFAALGACYQCKPSYPRVDFAEVWKRLLFNQFHDIIAGTSNGRACDDARAELTWVLAEGQALLDQGIEHIAGRIDTRGDGIPLVVFNPLSWDRTDVVEAVIRCVEPVDTLALRDKDGVEMPYQVLGLDAERRQWRILLLVEQAPSLGYKTVRAYPGQTPAFETALRASVTALENEYLRVNLTETGTVAGIFDKTANREMLSGEGNVFSLMREGNVSSSWMAVFDGSEKELEAAGAPRLVETGPVRAVLRRAFHSEDSTFDVDVVLCAGAPRVEFVFNADWHDRDATLLVRFPTVVNGGAGAVELPYGFEEAASDGTRRCAHNWVDLSNTDCGVSLLNDGRYEFYLEGASLRMGVLRGAHDMDPRMDEGAHRLRYALYPHAGPWRDAGTVRQAYALNNPLIAAQEPHHDGRLGDYLSRSNDYALPPELSFFRVSHPDVMVSVVKMPQAEWTSDGEIVVRLVETSGRAASCVLTTPFRLLRAIETDHLEQTTLRDVEAKDNAVPFEFAPGEVKTVILRHGAVNTVIENVPPA